MKRLKIIFALALVSLIAVMAVAKEMIICLRISRK